MSITVRILSDVVNAGKSTFLKQWLNNKKSIAGVLQPKIEGKRFFEIYPFEELIPMETPTGTLEVGKYNFDISAFEKVERKLWSFFESDDINTLVIDEIGPLEIKKSQGLHNLLLKILSTENSSNKTVILVVRESCLQDFVEKYSFENVQIKSKENWDKGELINGLILCGGKSSRMNTDKGLIAYHSIPQWQYLHKLLSTVCDNVYISLNAQQIKLWNLPYGVEYIEDCEEFINHGPMTGLLSACKKLERKPLLIVGCDYPNVRLEHLFCLIKNRTNDAGAVCFEHNGFTEPLISFIEEKSIDVLYKYFDEGNDSIKRFLETICANKIKVTTNQFLQNVNTL